jgi:hypothetical protein
VRLAKATYGVHVDLGVQVLILLSVLHVLVLSLLPFGLGGSRGISSNLLVGGGNRGLPVCQRLNSWIGGFTHLAGASSWTTVFSGWDMIIVCGVKSKVKLVL